jgi:hypothetical protein
MAYDRRQNRQRNRGQRDLASEMERYITKLQPADGARRKQGSALAAVWKKLVTPQLAEHTDNVIYDKQNRQILVVYMDGPIWVAESEMQKEQYRLLLAEALKQPISDLRFQVSRKTGGGRSDR